MSDDNYINQSIAWQKGHQATIEMLENQIAYSEKDIEFTKRKLYADKEQLKFVKQTYDDHMIEYNKYLQDNAKATP